MKTTDENVLHGTISTGESVTTGTSDNNDITTGNYRLAEYMIGEMIKTIVKDDSIEIIYNYIPTTTQKLLSSQWYSYADYHKVCKIIYSCKNGKWHVSDPIIGKIIPAREESYEF